MRAAPCASECTTLSSGWFHGLHGHRLQRMPCLCHLGTPLRLGSRAHRKHGEGGAPVGMHPPMPTMALGVHATHPAPVSGPHPACRRGAASSDSEEEGQGGALQPEKTKRRLRRMMRETGLEDSEEEEEESAGGMLLRRKCLFGHSVCMDGEGWDALPCHVLNGHGSRTAPHATWHLMPCHAMP